MTRLLLGSLVALVAVVLIATVITAMAPVIAVGVVLFTAYKLAPARRGERDREGGLPINITPKSPR